MESAYHLLVQPHPPLPQLFPIGHSAFKKTLSVYELPLTPHIDLLQFMLEQKDTIVMLISQTKTERNQSPVCGNICLLKPDDNPSEIKRMDLCTTGRWKQFFQTGYHITGFLRWYNKCCSPFTILLQIVVDGQLKTLWRLMSESLIFHPLKDLHTLGCLQEQNLQRRKVASEHQERAW